MNNVTVATPPLLRIASEVKIQLPGWVLTHNDVNDIELVYEGDKEKVTTKKLYRYMKQEIATVDQSFIYPKKLIS